MQKNVYDVVIIGAGAAGLFCAAIAGRRGKRVLLLDHMAKPGGKILISGGGRCNFTNLSVQAENFISANPHFAKSALAGFSAQDFISLVEDANIPYHEKHLGQLFCDHSARDILGLLLGMCDAGGVEIKLGCTVSKISRHVEFSVETNLGYVSAPSLVLASGGLSIPKLGASSFSYEIARQFGLNIITPRPGLVPLTFTADTWRWMQDLAGVSLETICKFGKQKFQEAALFTHRGLSGPAVLQISSYLPPGAALTLDLLPGQNASDTLLAAKKTRPKSELKTALAGVLPARLAGVFTPPETTGRALGDIAHETLKTIGSQINQFTLTPSGTEGFAKAEVTVGGIDTADLSSQTMAAPAVPGLFAIGEAVDVTGWLGGYNFQWAWSSAFCAGEAV